MSRQTRGRQGGFTLLEVLAAFVVFVLVFGAVLGAGWLSLVGQSEASYLQLFGLSSAARLFALVFLMRVPHMDVRAVAMSLRTLALRPSEGGSFERPVLSTIDDDRTEDGSS